MKIVATTPYFEEPPELLVTGGASLPRPVLWHPYEIELGPEHPNESALRRPGLELALKAGAEWWLQLDADERLVGGPELVELLSLETRSAYPLPRLEESGAVSLCPYKLVRLPVELVLGCDHFRQPGDPRVWRYSLDRSATEQEIPRLLEFPHLVHEPSLRPASRKTRRVGELENVAESRPLDPVQWPGDSSNPWEVQAMSTQAPELDEQGEVTDSRPYYCPGCGARYETPGVCIGVSAEGGHPEMKVEKVKGGGESSSSSSSARKAGGARKSSARKKSSSSRSSRKTTAPA